MFVCIYTFTICIDFYLQTFNFLNSYFLSPLATSKNFSVGFTFHIFFASQPLQFTTLYNLSHLYFQFLCIILLHSINYIFPLITNFDFCTFYHFSTLTIFNFIFLLKLLNFYYNNYCFFTYF